MPKGIFTQSSIVLLDAPVARDVVSNLLCTFPILKLGTPERTSWIGGGDYLLIEMLKKVNGTLLIDMVNQPWPDAMGDAKTDPELFAAWGMGYFGPFVYPNSLQRALQYCHRCPELREDAPQHTAFIRLRTSYVLGAGKDAPMLPPRYAYDPEMMLLGKIIDRLLTLPEAICYFNPNGETLYTRDAARTRAAHFIGKKLPPLELWCNVRHFATGVAGWSMMDIVGMEQMDLPDSEAYLPDHYSTKDVGAFLVNASLYLSTKGPVLKAGSTMSGPGGPWRVRAVARSRAPAPRQVLKWFPDGLEIPPELLESARG